MHSSIDNRHNPLNSVNSPTQLSKKRGQQALSNNITEKDDEEEKAQLSVSPNDEQRRPENIYRDIRHKSIEAPGASLKQKKKI